MLLHWNAWHCWCIKPKLCKTVCSQASWIFFCLFFSIKETHWGIFFKLYPVSLSTDFIWILITEDPVHTLSSGSFKLFLKTHDQASTNFFLILHWVTLDKDIGICLNQKNSLCLPHQGLCAKHFLILHCIKLKINCTEETDRIQPKACPFSPFPY